MNESKEGGQKQLSGEKKKRQNKGIMLKEQQRLRE